MLHLHETLYPCGSGVPVRSLQCGLGQGKVNRKSPFSTNFLGNNAYFAYFLPDFTRFQGFCPPGTAPSGCSGGDANPR